MNDELRAYREAFEAYEQAARVARKAEQARGEAHKTLVSARQAAILAVRCDFCSAPPGQPCTGLTGGGPHAMRGVDSDVWSPLGNPRPKTTTPEEAP